MLFDGYQIGQAPQSVHNIPPQSTPPETSDDPFRLAQHHAIPAMSSARPPHITNHGLETAPHPQDDDHESQEWKDPNVDSHMYDVEEASVTGAGYPCRDYAARAGVNAAFCSIKHDEVSDGYQQNEQPSGFSVTSPQYWSAPPSHASMSGQAPIRLAPHQLGRKKPMDMRKKSNKNLAARRASIPPPIVAGQKRKRELPSQLEPADWLPPLSPARPVLYNSIDHSIVNPSNEIRAYCVYPAPPHVLAASKVMLDTNMANFQAKLMAGRNPSTNRIPWTIYEDDLVIKEMLKIRTDPTVPQTEKRFDVCIERVDWEAHGLFPRTHQGVKNMWCRVGRNRSGYDERKGFNQKPEHNRNGWRGKPGNTLAEKQANKAKRMRLDHGEEDEMDWYE